MSCCVAYASCIASAAPIGKLVCLCGGMSREARIGVAYVQYDTELLKLQKFPKQVVLLSRIVQ